MRKINFTSIFYSVQYIKILSFQHVINIQIVNEIFYFWFLYEPFGIWCVFHTYSLCPCGLATFQMLHSHVWLLATTLSYSVVSGLKGHGVLLIMSSASGII